MAAIETGFAIGTTTAVHELGHARRVLAIGGVSRWETGDVNWWSYLAHRDPLAAGTTSWFVPRIISVDQELAIAAGGFNATTLWDEDTEGRGPLNLFIARYSASLYEFAGIGSADDDLAQIETLYRKKGYNISRREMQLWQLFAGTLPRLLPNIRAYAYFTPQGISLRTKTRWRGWDLGFETVVQGSKAFEFEIGRRCVVRRNFTVTPSLVAGAHGLGGALKAEGTLGRARWSLTLQQIHPQSLQACRSTTSYNLQMLLPL
jgi:hypothetical protein